MMESVPPYSWRSNLEGPDAQTLFEQSRLEHNREEELFQRIMGEAQYEKTPLDELLRSTLRLAFPHAKDSDLERALGMIRARSAEWRNNLDQDGNPRWITLPLRERDSAKDTEQAGATRPPDTKDATRHSNKDATRLPDTKDDTKDADPPKEKAKPTFLGGLIRLVVFAGLVLLAYHILVVRGWLMP